MEAAQVKQEAIRVGVLFGGRSSEHAVSRRSAAFVVRSLAAVSGGRFLPIPIGITRAGEWRLRRRFADGEEPAALRSAALVAAADDALELAGEPVTLLLDPCRPGRIRPLAADAGWEARIDVAFPVLHGPYGEDGTIQGLLQVADLPLVGCAVLGAAVAMDKVAAKALLRDAGIPVTPGIHFTRGEWRRGPQAIAARCVDNLGYPYFVKPANLGSSVGISKVHDPSEATAALAEAARFDRRILAEAAISEAQEIEVAILGNDDPEASVAGEIRPSREFYDYAAKYQDDASELLIPAPLPPATTERLRDLALQAARVLDLQGLARVDFLLRGSDHTIFLNEVNTMPGFTEISMYPKLWAASGVPGPELVTRLVEFALQAHAERRRNALEDPGA
jgi:D-alanine-D-alanine ligase